MIVKVVPTTTIFSYEPHSNMCGGGDIVPLGGGVMALLFWSGKDSKKRENVYISIFLSVAQDELYKIPVTYFVERFYENISTKCVNDS